MADALYWIWFQQVFGLGTRRSHALMEYFADPKDIFDGIAGNERVRCMLGQKELDASPKAMERAELLLARTLKKGCAVVTPDHPDYPPLLQGIYAKPSALYVKGDLGCLRDALVIAMVGTRKFSEYGEQVARFLAGGLAKSGVVVVSGLAHGIDSHSHEAALQAGGYSIGVLGCGIDVDYPAGDKSRALKRAMSEHGAVVSEYPLGEGVWPGNFPLRNRLISGMAHGVVVVEADEKSGSIITANHALEQGRDVFSVPGSIFSYRELGTHKLIREGAKLVGAPEDILEEYPQFGYAREAAAHNFAAGGIAMKEEAPQQETLRERAPLPEDCSENAGLVYARIGEQPMGVDAIAEQVALSVGEIQTALTELEIYGLIRGYPGRMFSI